MQIAPGLNLQQSADLHRSHLPPRPAGMPPHAHFIALIFGKELSPSAANFRVFPRHDRR
jgi:hypothetical protein